MSENRRLMIIETHLTSHFNFNTKNSCLDEYRKRGRPFNSELLREMVFSPFYSVYKSMWNAIKDRPDLFNRFEEFEMSRDAIRERAHKQMTYLCKKSQNNKELNRADPDLRKAMGIGFTAYDLGLGTKSAVHFVLYMETIESLGTEKHKPLIERAYDLKDYGCCAMTELGHGSNFLSIETQANYDHHTREFVINSPTPTSAKWWIGAAAKTANRAVLFAQLIINGTNYGVHSFAIKIRDKNTHRPCRGIIIGDCGAKAGLDSIDNGFILFKNYRAPYDCLLDRFSQISNDGKFKSLIKKNEKRLGVMLSGLMGGRTGLPAAVDMSMKNALTIAIRYSAVRQQFGEQSENSILDYQLQRHRLMPHLANNFAVNMAFKLAYRLRRENLEIISVDYESAEMNELHAIFSAFKAIAGWYSRNAIQECREACGGHGYSAYSGLPRLRADADAHLTWEGDNNIILQQTSRYLMKLIQGTFKGIPIKSQLLNFIKIDPIKPDFNSKSQLRNPEFLLSMLEYKFNYQLNSSLFRIQNLGQKMNNITAVWNNSQVFYLKKMAISFGEVLMAKEFYRFAKEIGMKCKETEKVVESIMLLYMNHIFEQETGPFLSCFSEEQMRMIEETVLELCNEVTEDSVRVVDAIAVPDHILNSVLGNSDGQVYERYIKAVENAPCVYDLPKWTKAIKEMQCYMNKF